MADPASSAIEGARALTDYGPIGIVCFLMFMGIIVVVWFAYGTNNKLVERSEEQAKACDTDRKSLIEKLNEREKEFRALQGGMAIEMQKTAVACNEGMRATAAVADRMMRYLEDETRTHRRQTRQSGEHG